MTLFRKFCMAFTVICLIGLVSWMAFMLYNKPEEVLISLASLVIAVIGGYLFSIGLAEIDNAWDKWKEQK
jgi:hypothetical protein